MPSTRIGLRLGQALLAGVMVVGTLALPAAASASAAVPVGFSPIAAPTANMVTADALPTVQIDGVVWAQALSGNTVYAGGSFRNARPAGAAAGTNQTPRGNLMSFDVTTGTLNTAFAPSLNAQVKAVTVTPDGSRVYVGGDFTTANGQTRGHIAAYDTATNALVTAFAPNVNGRVNSIVVLNGTVYVGGDFTQVNGISRIRLAAFRATDGALLGWNPGADAVVNAMTLTPDKSKLVVGGAFANIGTTAAYGMAALDPTTGRVLAWSTTDTVRNAGKQAAITSLTTAGTSVYGTGYVYGAGGNLEGTFRADGVTGALQWVEDCHGDTYSAAIVNSIVYTVSHAHYCGNIGGFPQTDPWSVNQRHTLAFTDDATGTVGKDPLGYFNWAGNASPSLYSWFPELKPGTITGQGQAAWSVVANSKYVVEGGEFPSVNGVAQSGLVRFAVSSLAPKKQGPRLYGTGGWTPTVTGLQAGTVRVAWPSNWDRDDLKLTYTVTRSGTVAYTTVASSTYWNLPILGFIDKNLVPGKTYSYRVTATDSAGNAQNSTIVSIVAPDATSSSQYAQRVVTDGAAPFWRLSESSGTSAIDYSGFYDGTVGTSVGRGVPGAISGDANTASSFDGTAKSTLVSNASSTAPDTFTVEAWFKTSSTQGGKIIGFGNSASGLSGSYDRHVYMDNAGHIVFGVYPGGARTVTSNSTFNDGGWHQVVASLGAQGMKLYVDGIQVGARADTTSGQAYIGYWRVGGDNIGGWPGQPTSPYFYGSLDEVAVYPTALSADDVLGHFQIGTGAPVANKAPVAVFTSQVAGLGVKVDGSTSSDSDGSVASYSWNWGDNSPAGSGAAPSHTYAAAGTYPVTLTVTDDKGATGTVAHNVTLAAATSSVAKDTFGRTIAGSWGSAEVGGSWTPATNSGMSVTGGLGLLKSATAGTGPTAILSGVASQDVTGTVDVTVDKVATGGGSYATVIARRAGTSDYRVKLRFVAGGSLQLVTSRVVSGTETTLATVTVADTTFNLGDTLRLRFGVKGNGTTTLTGKVWKVGAAEPVSNQLTRTDTTASLQAAGTLGVQAYLSGTATNAPVTAKFDNLSVQSG